MCFAPKGSSPPSIPPRGGQRGNTPPSRDGNSYSGQYQSKTGPVSRPQSQSKPYDPQSRCPICKGEFPQSVLQFHVNKCYANKHGGNGGGDNGGGGGGGEGGSNTPLMADHSMIASLDPMSHNGANIMQQQMIDQNGNPLPWRDREKAVDREYEREVASRGSFYDGFGRPGCGAPTRGRNGEIITNVRNLDSQQQQQQQYFSPVQPGYGNGRSVSTPVQRAPYLSPLNPPGSPGGGGGNYPAPVSRFASMYTTTNSEYGSHSRCSTPASSSRSSFSSRFQSPMASPNPYLRDPPQSACLPSRMVETSPSTAGGGGNGSTTYPPIRNAYRNDSNDDDMDDIDGGNSYNNNDSNPMGGMHINPDGTTTITPKERAAILSVIDENKALRQENEELQTMIMGLKQVIKNYRERFGPID